MRILIDSREQAPYSFQPPRYEGVTHSLLQKYLCEAGKRLKVIVKAHGA